MRQLQAPDGQDTTEWLHRRWTEGLSEDAQALLYPFIQRAQQGVGDSLAVYVGQVDTLLRPYQEGPSHIENYAAFVEVERAKGLIATGESGQALDIFKALTVRVETYRREYGSQSILLTRGSPVQTVSRYLSNQLSRLTIGREAGAADIFERLARVGSSYGDGWDGILRLSFLPDLLEAGQLESYKKLLTEMEGAITYQIEHVGFPFVSRVAAAWLALEGDQTACAKADGYLERSVSILNVDHVITNHDGEIALSDALETLASLGEVAKSHLAALEVKIFVSLQGFCDRLEDREPKPTTSQHIRCYRKWLALMPTKSARKIEFLGRLTEIVGR